MIIQEALRSDPGLTSGTISPCRDPHRIQKTEVRYDIGSFCWSLSCGLNQGLWKGTIVLR